MKPLPAQAGTVPPFLGIDRLLDDPARWIGRRRVALLANQASLTSDGRPTLEAVRERLGSQLVALLSPEHGWSGFESDATPIEDQIEPHSGLPVISLYGPRRRPDSATLARFDAVLVDLREVGVRCYTYAATVALLLEAAREHGTEVIICDRPGMLGPRLDGPGLASEYRSFLGYLPVPYQHALTLGELARFYAAHLGGAPLTVVPLQGWVRGQPEAGPFVPPSPGLSTPESVLLYPGLVLLEGTGLSEGRGTPLPFQLLGAPGLDGYALARAVNGMGLPGLLARPLTFQPESGKLVGQICEGIHLHVTGPAFRPLTAVIRILRLLFEEGCVTWTASSAMPWASLPGAGAPWHEPVTGWLIDALVGDESVRRVIEGRLELEEAEQAWARDQSRFLDEVQGVLLYRGAPERASRK